MFSVPRESLKTSSTDTDSESRPNKFSFISNDTSSVSLAFKRISEPFCFFAKVGIELSIKLRTSTCSFATCGGSLSTRIVRWMEVPLIPFLKVVSFCITSAHEFFAESLAALIRLVFVILSGFAKSNACTYSSA